MNKKREGKKREREIERAASQRGIHFKFISDEASSLFPSLSFLSRAVRTIRRIVGARAWSTRRPTFDREDFQDSSCVVGRSAPPRELVRLHATRKRRFRSGHSKQAEAGWLGWLADVLFEELAVSRNR